MPLFLATTGRGLAPPRQKVGDHLEVRHVVPEALNVFGLRRHGEKIAERGGKNAKKRAVVGVARKLSVLLHRLWITGEVYEPLHNARKAQIGAA